jgi:hypothetical protein
MLYVCTPSIAAFLYILITYTLLIFKYSLSYLSLCIRYVRRLLFLLRKHYHLVLGQDII